MNPQTLLKNMSDSAFCMAVAQLQLQAICLGETCWPHSGQPTLGYVDLVINLFYIERTSTRGVSSPLFEVPPPPLQSYSYTSAVT